MAKLPVENIIKSAIDEVVQDSMKEIKLALLLDLQKKMKQIPSEKESDGFQDGVNLCIDFIEGEKNNILQGIE